MSTSRNNSSSEQESQNRTSRKKGGAPKGNQFWKLRSKHGRDKLFETPELLWEAACEYFEWCEENPLIGIEYNGKDAKRCEVPHMRAFTIHGLCLYLNGNTRYFNDFDDAIKQKKKLSQQDKDFSDVITRIRETIFAQKFEGAAAGFLKENLISRDLGLVDKKGLDESSVLKVIVES